MKQFTFAVTVLAVLITFGCREVGVEPIVAEPVIPNPNVITFGNIVNIPSLGEIGQQLQFVGTATYEFYALGNGDNLNKNAADLYDLHILTEGRLKSDDELKPLGRPWTISGKSIDQISIAADNSVTLEKQYRVQGMAQEVYINVLFEVQRERLLYLKMWASGAD